VHPTIPLPKTSCSKSPGNKTRSSRTDCPAESIADPAVTFGQCTSMSASVAAARHKKAPGNAML
jgi:hypothetical protein